MGIDLDGQLHSLNLKGVRSLQDATTQLGGAGAAAAGAVEQIAEAAGAELKQPVVQHLLEARLPLQVSSAFL